MCLENPFSPFFVITFAVQYLLQLKFLFLFLYSVFQIPLHRIKFRYNSTFAVVFIFFMKIHWQVIFYISLCPPTTIWYTYYTTSAFFDGLDVVFVKARSLFFWKNSVLLFVLPIIGLLVCYNRVFMGRLNCKGLLWHKWSLYKEKHSVLQWESSSWYTEWFLCRQNQRRKCRHSWWAGQLIINGTTTSTKNKAS